jgi:hypothetical protein
MAGLGVMLVGLVLILANYQIDRLEARVRELEREQRERRR